MDAQMSPTQERISLSPRALWFLTICGTTIVSALISTLHELTFPLVYARYVLGSLLILYLPGSCVVKTLFPAKEFFSVERIALCVLINLAEVSVLGLTLNYTRWGITETTISLGLLVLTLVSAVVAIAKK